MLRSVRSISAVSAVRAPDALHTALAQNNLQYCSGTWKKSQLLLSNSYLAGDFSKDGHMLA